MWRLAGISISRLYTSNCKPAGRWRVHTRRLERGFNFPSVPVHHAPTPPMLANLRQWLYCVFCVHVAHDDAKAVGALELLDAVVDVLWLQ